MSLPLLPGQLCHSLLSGHLSQKTKTYQQRTMSFLFEIQYTCIMYYDTSAPFGGQFCFWQWEIVWSHFKKIYICKDVYKTNIRNITLSHLLTFLWSNPNSKLSKVFPSIWIVFIQLSPNMVSYKPHTTLVLPQGQTVPP